MIKRFIRKLIEKVALCSVNTGTMYVAIFLLMITLSDKGFAQSPPLVSQIISVSQGVVDENGEPLKGADSFAKVVGAHMANGDLVQILKTTDNTIYPPGSNGQPDPRNVILSTTRIGVGVSPALTRSGKFSTAVSPRPAFSTKLFVRVFNAPSIEEATYYGDSQLFTVSSVSNTYFLASIASTDKPLDSADPDGDGLSNAQEQSFGSDPYAPDTDGDGLSDADELVAGTDALNGDSVPLITAVRPVGSGLVQLDWSPTVSGRTYRIYQSTNQFTGAITMVPIAAVINTGNVHSIWLTNTVLSSDGALWFKVSK